MCCTGLSLSLGPARRSATLDPSRKGRFFERLPHQDASLKKSKLSQIKPSPSHHSSGITFSKQKHRFAEKPFIYILLLRKDYQISSVDLFLSTKCVVFATYDGRFWNKTVVFF
jgi:hypothetical protein